MPSFFQSNTWLWMFWKYIVKTTVHANLFRFDFKKEQSYFHASVILGKFLCLSLVMHTAWPVNDATIGSTQVAPMCASCVLPRKVAFVVWVFDSALIGSDGCYLRASCMLPACFLLYYYPSFPSKLNWTETQTIWSTFLGSMQEAHMGATCVLPSVATSTGRSVCVFK